MSQFSFDRISNIDNIAIEQIRIESEQEGYRFVNRLISDWLNDTNRFNLKGEGFYGVWAKEELIAIGGINQDPYSQTNSSGRLRRFYVRPFWRRKKVGQKLLGHILTNHTSFFDEITLFTDTEAASHFYESFGFEKVSGRYKISHKYVSKT